MLHSATARDVARRSERLREASSHFFSLAATRRRCHKKQAALASPGSWHSPTLACSVAVVASPTPRCTAGAALWCRDPQAAKMSDSEDDLTLGQREAALAQKAAAQPAAAAAKPTKPKAAAVPESKRKRAAAEEEEEEEEEDDDDESESEEPAPRRRSAGKQRVASEGDGASCPPRSSPTLHDALSRTHQTPLPASAAVPEAVGLCLFARRRLGRLAAQAQEEASAPEGCVPEGCARRSCEGEEGGCEEGVQDAGSEARHSRRGAPLCPGRPGRAQPVLTRSCGADQPFAQVLLVAARAAAGVAHG